MKRQWKFYGYALLMVSLVLSSGFSLKGQGIDLVAGGGVPELIFLGVRFPTGKVQAALNVGALPVSRGENMVAASGEILYYFTNEDKQPERHPIYARAGLTYLRDKNDRSTDKYLLLNARGGMEFPISDNIGIGTDVGISYILSHEEARNPNYTPDGSLGFNLDLPVWPAFGVRLTYRLQ